MTKDRFWRAISIDSVSPDNFPNVALYLKSGGNYVLYKDNDRAFTAQDRQRMKRSQVEFIYIRSGDMEEVNSYLENNLSAILLNDDLDSNAKGKIIYQTSVNCVIDTFEFPEQSTNQARCRKLIQNLIKYVAGSPETMESLKSITVRNYYIFTHSVQVTALNLMMHEKLFSVSHEEMVDVGIGSLLHDFGMTFISDEILDKPDALSSVEYYKIKAHTTKGYDFLKQGGAYSDLALTIVRHHHERYDGNGYPSALKANDIPRSAQLAAICDVYSALINDQPHQKGTSPAEALRIMRNEAAESGGSLNPLLFERFEEIISSTVGVTNHERMHLLPSN